MFFSGYNDAMTHKDIKELKKKDSEIALLSHTASILGWDQETYIPSASIEERSRQLSLLSGLIHERLTSDTVRSIFSGVDDEKDLQLSDLDEAECGYVRKFFDNYKKQTALSAELVMELSRQASITQSVWVDARKKNDFSLFAAQFEKLLSLVLEKAECYGYEKSPYDALLDEYEKGITAADVDSVFTPLEGEVRKLLDKIKSVPQIDDSFLRKKYPSDLQDKAGKILLGELGYDLSRGRLDISAIPLQQSSGSMISVLQPDTMSTIIPPVFTA